MPELMVSLAVKVWVQCSCSGCAKWPLVADRKAWNRKSPDHSWQTKQDSHKTRAGTGNQRRTR
eukprot:5288235-Amphidinium_carterae.1